MSTHFGPPFRKEAAHQENQLWLVGTVLQITHTITAVAQDYLVNNLEK